MKSIPLALGSLALMATLPGLQLYQRYGFQATEEVVLTLPDGVRLPCVAMERPVD